jgi:hypothetical protein
LLLAAPIAEKAEIASEEVKSSFAHVPAKDGK